MTCLILDSKLLPSGSSFSIPFNFISEVVGESATKATISPKSCVQYSLLSDTVTIDEKAVVEYCKILNDKPVHIGSDTIMSQISLPPTVTEISGISLFSFDNLSFRRSSYAYPYS